jgi:hypothetical protein
MMLLMKLLFASAITLVFIGYYTYFYYFGDKTQAIFPPFIAKCPDYWDVVGDNKCRNVNKIGVCLHGDGTLDSDVMDFNIPIFEGKKGLYYKCSWANKCKTPWEGIDKLCI